LRFAEAKELVESFIKAKVDCVITGEAQSGKTSLAREAALDAPIIHDFELSREYLGAIKTVITSSKAVIVENATQESAKFLEPILATRTILASAFDAVFIITTRHNLLIEGCAAIKIAPIEANDWLKRAKETKVHPALIALVEEDFAFLKRHDLKTIDALSKLLCARVSAKRLEKAIGATLGEDKEAIAALVESLLEPIVSSDGVYLSTDENAKAYENALAEKIKTGASKEDVSRFIEYVSASATDRPKEALTLLKRLLSSRKAADALEQILRDKRVQKIIDDTIAQIDMS
jgi:hypothetical protein